VGDVLLSILPCWHIFERAAEYCFLARGATLTYSSIKTLKADLEVSAATGTWLWG
jgi:long-chain acyl-CoA synthetase